MTTQVAIHTGLARKFNHFEDQGTATEGHACASCVRRQFGGPFCCEDGWPKGDPNWRDQGARCLNWTDRGNAPV
jgi:hypothetical protein